MSNERGSTIIEAFDATPSFPNVSLSSTQFFFPATPECFSGLTGAIAANSLNSLNVFANQKPLVTLGDDERIRSLLLEMTSSFAFSTISDTALSNLSAALSQIGEFALRAFNSLDIPQASPESIFETLRPSIDSIAQAFSPIDKDAVFNRYSSASKEWGERGWVLFDDMPSKLVLNCPSSYIEANRANRPYAIEMMPSLRDRVLGNARKKTDVREMFSLYDEGHYKASAMMACSVIEGELFNWKISKSNNRRVKSSPKDLTIPGDDKFLRYAAIDLTGLVAAYDYFFKPGNGFDRQLEGELNRNFLLHGMMYRPVSQVVCIKLFLLRSRRNCWCKPENGPLVRETAIA